jgi:pyruvate/2-oxoglutarate/acetoin dehydrogenase E1 component
LSYERVRKAVLHARARGKFRDDGEQPVSELRYRDALKLALREEMLRDESVVLLGEDIGVFGGAFKVTSGLLEEFGERRVRDTPISENTIVGMGVGAAMVGLRPVVELMTVNFALLAFDQIVNHAAHIHYMFGGQARVPLVVRMPQGAGHQLGPTHSHSLEAMFLHVPGLLVAVPSTAADARGLLKAAIRDENPVIFIEQAFDDLDAPVLRVSGADVPMPYSKPLEEIAFPHEPHVVRAALNVLGRDPSVVPTTLSATTTHDGQREDAHDAPGAVQDAMQETGMESEIREASQ